MNQEIVEDEVFSDSHSGTSSRRNSSISSQMANTRSRRSSITRQSSFTDTNENKQSKQQQQLPIKVLVFNGKCSEIFKSTLEDCVEDCILEFPGENSIYVPKPGQAIQIPPGSKQNFMVTRKEQHNTGYQSGRLSNRRRSSTNQFNLAQIGGARTSQTSNVSLSTTALAATSVARMRHQLAQQRCSFPENISEEATDLLTTIEQEPTPLATEVESEHPNPSQDETISYPSNFDLSSQSHSHSPRKLPSAPANISYRDRQKDYRLSDLVMLGPEYFANVFNLPRPSRHTTQSQSRQRSSTQQRHNKAAEKYSELDRIKQDLFHRYLWTQKPQVSCRIRPMSTYARSTTFVI